MTVTIISITYQELNTQSNLKQIKKYIKLEIPLPVPPKCFIIYKQEFKTGIIQRYLPSK